MKAPHLASWVISYTCGCNGTNRGAPPKLGKDVHCVRHNDTVYVTAVVPEMMITCRDCRYKRYYGNEPFAAKTYAVKHSVTRRHKIAIYKGTKLVEIIGENRQQLALVFDADDPPPF